MTRDNIFLDNTKSVTPGPSTGFTNKLTDKIFIYEGCQLRQPSVPCMQVSELPEIAAGELHTLTSRRDFESSVRRIDETIGGAHAFCHAQPATLGSSGMSS